MAKLESDALLAYSKHAATINKHTLHMCNELLAYAPCTTKNRRIFVLCKRTRHITD
jgi:hypothetical protein